MVKRQPFSIHSSNPASQDFVSNTLIQKRRLIADRMRSSSLQRRMMLLAVIVFTIALPRAGIVIPGLNLPLPAGFVLIQFIFWHHLFSGRISRIDRALLDKAQLFIFALFLAGLFGLMRGAVLKMVVIDLSTAVGPVPAFFAMIWLIREERDLTFALKCISMCILAASVYGVVQYYFGTSVLIRGLTYNAGNEYAKVNLTYGAGNKVLSSYGDPNVFANALILYFPLLLTALHGMRTAGRFFFWRNIVNGALLAAGVALLYCDSRAGYLGLMIGAGGVFWKTNRRMLHAVLPLLLAFGIASELGIMKRTKDFNKRLNFGSGDPRSDYAWMFREIMLSYPEGTGLGVQAEVGDVVEQKIVLTTVGSVWQMFNSFYMHLASRSGLLGLVSFLYMCLSYAWYPWRFAHSPACPKEWKPVIWGQTMGIAAIQIGLLANPIYVLPGGGTNMWLALGLACSVRRVFEGAAARRPGIEPVRLTRRWLGQRA